MRVRILARFKNANLAEAIEEQGFKTQKAFALYYGFKIWEIGEWLNFKNYPKTKERINRIERATKKLFEDLFPKEYRDAVDRSLGRPIQKTISIFELPPGFQPKYYLDSPQKEFEKKQILEKMSSFLKERLSRKEYIVIKHRFGLEECEELELHQIGKIFKVTSERIRQIEAKALRKLKYSSFREEVFGDKDYIPTSFGE